MNSVAVLLLFLGGWYPADRPVVVDRVTKAEVNHLYDGAGNLVLDQILWWDWVPADSRFEVVDWRILNGCRKEDDRARQHWQYEHAEGPPYVPEFIPGHATPHRDRDGRRVVSEWRDEKSDRWRRVIADIATETWTSFDPELQQREMLPQEKRRGLSR